MKISVWDTYVSRKDGLVMHFDILVPSENVDASKVFGYGNLYLESKPFKVGNISTNECKYCHIEQASQEVIDEISKNGFSIIEMDNCNQIWYEYLINIVKIANLAC